jgi:uncharacterized protein (DUF3820 family)
MPAATITPLKDTDLMPFGTHKGKQMQDVPATYLSWLRKQGCTHPRVSAYIEWAWKAIQMELKGR